MNANFKPSKSEKNGVKAADPFCRAILSIGISTAGSAEIALAEKCRNAFITATTIDEAGLAFTTQTVKQSPFASRIDCRWEDCTKPFPYDDQTFDYVYSRLCLQYLDKAQLDKALCEIYRVLRDGSKLYVAVRSADDKILKLQQPAYDEKTGMTAFFPWLYLENNPDNFIERKQFFTEESLTEKLMQHGFAPQVVKTFNEILYADYRRTKKVTCPNTIIETVAVKRGAGKV